jgi:hypothetical protein
LQLLYVYGPPSVSQALIIRDCDTAFYQELLIRADPFQLHDDPAKASPGTRTSSWEEGDHRTAANVFNLFWQCPDDWWNSIERVDIDDFIEMINLADQLYMDPPCSAMTDSDERKPRKGEAEELFIRHIYSGDHIEPTKIFIVSIRQT